MCLLTRKIAEQQSAVNDAIPSVVDRLADSDAAVRKSALDALKIFGTQSELNIAAICAL